MTDVAMSEHSNTKSNTGSALDLFDCGYTAVIMLSTVVHVGFWQECQRGIFRSKIQHDKT